MKVSKEIVIATVFILFVGAIGYLAFSWPSETTPVTPVTISASTTSPNGVSCVKVPISGMPGYVSGYQCTFEQDGIELGQFFCVQSPVNSAPTGWNESCMPGATP